MVHLLLTTKVASSFAPEVKQRGNDYYRQGAVTGLKGDSRRAEARVIGSDDYRVDIRFNPRTHSLRLYCDCPYLHDRMEPCKHLWAAIRAAELKGMLTAAIMGDEAIRVTVMDDRDDAAPPEQESPPAEPLPAQGARPRQRSPIKGKVPLWLAQLQSLELNLAMQPGLAVPDGGGLGWPADRQLVYIVDLQHTLKTSQFQVQIAIRQATRKGAWSRPKSKRMDRGVIDHLPDALDRQILTLLAGAGTEDDGYSYSRYDDRLQTNYTLSMPMIQSLLPMIAGTGRLFLRADAADERIEPATWDAGQPWRLRLRVEPAEGGKAYHVRGYFQRGDDRMEMDRPRMIHACGLVFVDQTIGSWQEPAAFAWVDLLRAAGSLKVPADQADALVERLLVQPMLPPVDWPEALAVGHVVGVPKSCLRVRKPRELYGGQAGGVLAAQWSFDYGGMVVPGDHPQSGFFERKERRFIQRDRQAEQAARQQLIDAGFRRADPHLTGPECQWSITPRMLDSAVFKLAQAGWLVEAEGKVFRSGGGLKMEVASGIDWFELKGEAMFDGQAVTLPELLTAIRSGQKAVRLGDGSYGILPQQWLEQFALVSQLGEGGQGALRFTRHQAIFLDALLAEQPQIVSDAAFTEARRQLQRFDGVAPADPPESFVGQLRPYQREGLGWLKFLRQFGFGGCLADDMGLGKTVQVLAMLETRRLERLLPQGPPPSLVVAPRSLVFNWKQEAARFTPELRVLDHTGIDRATSTVAFQNHDLVLTTYGTLRQDAAMLKDFRFDYAILDESQAIKNADTASAKAARLLRADHRLALSGTPIENHLGELWSLMEFLNPGLRAGASLSKLSQSAAPSPQERRLIARMIRPLMLRRTKAQVASDLPPRTEQTLYCELEGEQQRLYDELRRHYRQSLLPMVASRGMNRSKIQVLEALLRLRQAACHPGLIDPVRASMNSAKLDSLAANLSEVVEEGHKALVFSQFTSLLALVKDRLAREMKGVAYEYLDGQTRDREQRVRRFQEDPDCKLFLISLKAGGVGLNLTAAEYVFLLDPWWNPAVEAQAIDRAHRIGQTRHVMAYRLIARGTVEEKVLKLQESKRELADAILSEDSSVLRDLDRESLEMLLS
jgi:superfamily II DNA or RNA helicase